MKTDHTQQQSTEQRQRAQKLSLKRTRPPSEVRGYEIQEFLGSGAYGEVWVGVDQNTGRRVAVKFYTHQGGLDWSLLSGEVEKLAVLAADRYVVQLLDVGWEADPPYYVMDYIENGSLEDALKQRGGFDVEEAVELFEEVAVGLMHLHGKGVLHCDLKPANVLLDEDHKPRLADFGQSRLSHDQSPALGTLFYMAPEQADLEAVPDTRWDVYALGALLYCMLVGEPPHRSDKVIREVDSATELGDRLARYRTAIAAAPRPAKHRQVRGVDRQLADIIDRCLANNPTDRYASVQSVLEALLAREVTRARRPLMMLGFVGPLLLLAIMVLFGWRGYTTALNNSKIAVEKRAYEANEFFANSVARTIEEEIPRYFRAAKREAESPQLHAVLKPVLNKPELKQMIDPAVDESTKAALRTAFLDDPRQNQLKAYLDRQLAPYMKLAREDDRALKFASMFVTDPHGTILSNALEDPQQRSKAIGGNYAWRTYYHGGPEDLPADTPPDKIQPLTRTRLSAPFHSTTTRTWKVAVSTPIHEPATGELLGIMILSIELGDFAFFRNNDNANADHFAVLVDGREGNKGSILHHPFFRNQESTEEDYTAEKYRVDTDSLDPAQSDWQTKYRDPLRNAPGGEVYDGQWIASMEWVRLPSDDGDASPSPGQATRLAVIVQENHDATIDPIHQLGRTLIREGSLAFAGFALVVGVLWYFVLRMLNRGGAATGRAAPHSSLSTSLHSMKTLTAPNRPKR